jgi:hypothetical protein
MTTTSQALTGPDAARYKKIKDRFENLDRQARGKLAQKQGRIVKDAIKTLPKSVQEKINNKVADLIRTRIFGKREFEPRD